MSQPGKALCWFYAKKGTCTKGDECTFSHDLSSPNQAVARDRSLSHDPSRFDELSPEIAVKVKAGLHKSRICNHYLDNRCYRGDKCAFLHVSGPDAMPMICASRSFLADCLSPTKIVSCPQQDKRLSLDQVHGRVPIRAILRLQPLYRCKHQGKPC